MTHEGTAVPRRPVSRSGVEGTRRAGMVALAALPAALFLYLSFHAGGYFPTTTGLGILVLVAALLVRTLGSADPFRPLGRPLTVGAGALTGYALWLLLSVRWSHAPQRALIAFDLALLYALTLVVASAVPPGSSASKWMARGLAGAIVFVAAAALATRTLPDVFHVTSGLANQRLSFPLTYWNAMGLLCAGGTILCLGLSGTREQPRAIRVLGTAAVPILAVAQFYTFSRGAIVAVTAGLVVYAVLRRSWTLVLALLAVVPPTVGALIAAYEANLLATTEPTTFAAAMQGHKVAWITAVCAVAAGALRAVLIKAEGRAPGRHLDPERRRAIARAVIGVAVATILIAGALAHLPSRISADYRTFVRGAATGSTDLRARLTDPSNNGRTPLWNAALSGFEQDVFHGQGAETFEVWWDRVRSNGGYAVRNAHSLYLETLQEGGLVGIALLATALIALLVGLVKRARAPGGRFHAAIAAAFVAWMLEAGVDWVWQIPAATVWVFALVGLALAPAAEPSERRGTPVPPRVAAAVGLLVLAIAPALVAGAQSRLTSSVAALDAGRCAQARSLSRSSLEILSVQPEPHSIIGLCEAKGGELGSASAELQRAISYDPSNWRYHYGLALIEAAAGASPFAELASASRLSPREALTVELRASLSRLRTARARQAYAREALRRTVDF